MVKIAVTIALFYVIKKNSESNDTKIQTELTIQRGGGEAEGKGGGRQE